jgi:acyl phosphate:glycerol-3-phosphate acyltransferase
LLNQILAGASLGEPSRLGCRAPGLKPGQANCYSHAVLILLCAAVALAAYLMGSIPSGFLVARSRGLDIRASGSGNIGATNVFRVLGKPAGVFVLLVDALKGALACWLLPGAAAHLAGPAVPVDTELLALMAGLAAILGHNYTCWLRFKGGKGIATTAGVLLVLMPKAFALAVMIWGIVFAVSRYVSLGSITAACCLPFVVWGTGGSRTMIGLSIALCALALWKHQPNIQRLLDGTEHRFGRPKAGGTPPP